MESFWIEGGGGREQQEIEGRGKRGGREGGREEQKSRRERCHWSKCIAMLYICQERLS